MFFTKRLFHELSPALLSACLIIFSISFIHTNAQITQPHRYERKQKNADDYFNVISLQTEGLALFREQDKYRNGNKVWELIFLDTTLVEKKLVELEVKERYKLIGYEVVPGNIYFLYRTGETTRNSFELIQVTIEGEEKIRHEIKPDLDFRPTHFCKVGKIFAFGGYVNSDPAIFTYDTGTKLMKVLPGFFQKDTELVDLRANVNSTFNTVLIDRGMRGERKLFFRTFNEAGDLLLDDVVPVEENKTLQTGLTGTLEREDLIVLGNWGEKNSKQSKGFFSMTVDPFGDQKINYFDFGQLNHYLDYINPKRAEKIKQESKEDAENGRTPTYTNYVMPYRVAETKEGYYLLAEVYTPNSSSSPYYTSPFYNPYYYGPPIGYGSYSRGYQPYPYSPTGVRNTDIKTNESVLLAFDGNGALRGDYSLKLDDVELQSVEQASDFSLYNGKAYLLYRDNESFLKGKLIHLNDGTTEDLSEKIKTLESADQIRDEREAEGRIRYWYGNSLFVWGYQTIRNDQNSDRIRDVFYVNKIATH